METGSPEEHVRQKLHECIETGSLELPLLPQIANHVFALATDPDADTTKLASLLHQDQALAGQVLRIANSPAYMPRSPIVSLQQAVAWLGLRMLSDLALMISFQNGIFRIEGYEEEIKTLWRQALATAQFGKEIAILKRLNVENLFLCGLLHTIGKPVVLKGILDIQQQLGVTLAWDLVGKILSDLHTQVGTKVAESWELPTQVIESIRYYLDYTQAPGSNKGAMIICLADYLASYLLHPSSMDEATVLSHPVIEDLNLYPDEVASLLEQGEKILQIVDSMTL